MSSTTPTDVGELAVSEPDEPVPAQRSRLARSAPMLSFIARRILSSLLVLLGATFIVYMLFSLTADPLEDLRFSQDPNRDQLIAERIDRLNLDVPMLLRYFMWLGNVITGDLGSSWVNNQPVTALLGTAIPNTLQLVSAATVLAILLGILVGIVSALRQYTRFDYSVTFLSFLLFSLPSFWVAVLLKVWGAIGFNNFLRDPRIAWYMILMISLVGGALLSAIVAGSLKTRLLSFGISAVATAGVLFFISETDWLIHPRLDYFGVAVFGAAIAFAIVALTAGLGNRRALYASLTAAGVGVVLLYPLQFLFNTPAAGWLLMLGLAISAAICGCLIGWLFGGDDRGVSMRCAAITAVGTGVFIFIDRIMQIWNMYNESPRIRWRPIRTIGASTAGLEGDFWVTTLDSATHMILPTMTLLLISFAMYTRYTRASMLEVMNQDYIRTARSKGLSERVVTVRHAFRNALIPLATVIPLDIAAMFGGAIITESIFGWTGMGRLFITSLQNADIEPVMGHFLVIGSMLVLANIVVDFVYAALDPRIRVNA